MSLLLSESHRRSRDRYIGRTHAYAVAGWRHLPWAQAIDNRSWHEENWHHNARRRAGKAGVEEHVFDRYEVRAIQNMFYSETVFRT